VAIPIAGNRLSRQSYIIWHKGAYRNKAAVLFAEELLKISSKVYIMLSASVVIVFKQVDAISDYMGK